MLVILASRSLRLYF